MEFVSPFDQKMLRRLFVDAFTVADFAFRVDALDTHGEWGTFPPEVHEWLTSASVIWPRIEATRAMVDGMVLLEDHPLVLVEAEGMVSGFLHPLGLNRPAPRMWLFGMIGVIERHLGEAISLVFPDESWKCQLSEGRLAAASRLQSERRRCGEDFTLESCLQVGDKVFLLLTVPGAAEALGYGSRRQMKRGMKALETLRNRIAHHQEIHPACTEAALGMARRVQDLIAGRRLREALNSLSLP